MLEKLSNATSDGKLRRSSELPLMPVPATTASKLLGTKSKKPKYRLTSPRRPSKNTPKSEQYYANLHNCLETHTSLAPP
eukprot:4704839-Amphidinium_carterae.1